MKKIGIIGCGKIAQTRHIPEYSANPNARLAGFFDVNFQRAQELADKFGAKAYESYEAMLADGVIDAVSVTTPNFTHAEITLAALRAGKDVLCEKPMAVTLEDCENMVRTARELGRKLMIGHNQRLNQTHRKAKELIEAGAIGKVITFQTRFAHAGPDHWSIDGRNSWFMDKKSGCFGALADLGIHKTDLMIYLLGEKITEVSAVIGTLYKTMPDGTPISVDDNALCTYKTESGILGTMTASWTNFGKENNDTVLYGSEGVMRLYQDPNHSIVITYADGREAYYDIDTMQTNTNQTASGVIDMFMDAIVYDAPYISGEDVLPAMRAVFACVESANSESRMVKVR